MFGHKLETVRGTVVASRLGQAPAAGTQHQERIYTVDVQRTNGSTLRAEVTALAFMNAELPAGSAVQLEWNPKTDEVRFDPHHPVARTPSVREAMHLARDLRGEMAGGGLASAIAGLAEAAAEGKLGPGVHISTGGAEVHVAGATEVRMVGGEQTAELMQALMAGGAQRAAAIEKMRQIKTDMLAQSGHAPAAPPPGVPGQPGHQGPAAPPAPEGFSSSGGPSTFDEVQAAPPAVQPVPPAAAVPPTFSSPEPAFGTPNPAFGSQAPPFTPPAAPAVPPSFGQPTQPGGGFGSTPQGSFGAFNDSFGGSFGQDTKAERVARLQDMRNRGQLSQEQFEARRQQIMDEI